MMATRARIEIPAELTEWLDSEAEPACCKQALHLFQIAACTIGAAHT